MNRTERRNINRANAQLSTGPATEEGKATTSQNALKHGLTSLKPYLPVEETDYNTYAAERLIRLAPETTDERDLAQTITDIEWRLKRIPSLEARLFEDNDTDPHKTIRSLDVLSRHEVRLRKQLNAAMLDLINAQCDRSKYIQAIANPDPRNPIGFVLKNATPPSYAHQVATMNAATKALSQAA